MSRAYQMDLAIRKYNKTRLDDITDAVEDEWNGWHEGDAGKDSYFWTGQGNLYGGETPEHFANRVAQRLWDVNGGPLEITIAALFLEIAPDDYFEFDAKNPPQQRYDREGNALITVPLVFGEELND